MDAPERIKIWIHNDNWNDPANYKQQIALSSIFVNHPQPQAYFYARLLTIEGNNIYYYSRTRNFKKAWAKVTGMVECFAPLYLDWDSNPNDEFLVHTDKGVSISINNLVDHVNITINKSSTAFQNYMLGKT